MKRFLPFFLLFSSFAVARPLLLFPGWGPKGLTNMKDVRQFFIEDGYSPKDIHQFLYPYQKDLLTIADFLKEKLEPLIESYPAGTQFDVVTHSYGEIAGLYSLLKGGWGNRIAHFVSLDGTFYGQDELPLGCRRHLYSCRALEDLTPFKGPFLMGLISGYEEQISHIQKCSFYIEDDKLLSTPSDSGSFDDGVNIALKNIRHLQLIHSRKIYEMMREKCGF